MHRTHGQICRIQFAFHEHIIPQDLLRNLPAWSTNCSAPMSEQDSLPTREPCNQSSDTSGWAQ